MRSKPRITYYDFGIMREQAKLRILQQELLMKSEVKELVSRFSFSSLRNKVVEGFINNPSLPFRIGVAIFSAIAGKRSRRRR
jgi:hypothetical protein